MFEILRDFKIGRPQVLAGLMLLAFLAQCLWAARSRKISALEYQYMFSGLAGTDKQQAPAVSLDSPFTSFVAALPVRAISGLRTTGPASWNAYLAVPRPWILRLPFVMFGVWLGGALWWVARRLFDNEGGYVALGLYCTSPAMIKVSANIGPEIVLAWSLLGLIYTAIGVAHTLYAPPRKWAPRIVILGLSIGFALGTAWWSFALVILAFVYMLYLAPGCRKKVLVVLVSACALGCLVWLAITWITGSAGTGLHELLAQQASLGALRELAFALSAKTDGYVLVFLFITALTAYGSWPRARYFGNTAPLATAFVCVAVFALAPATHLWDATLALSFVFIFIGGVSADLLETGFRRQFALVLLAGFLVRAVLTLPELRSWVQNLM
jgi:Dolichyl-phosphate-mannose-protein mannosyltransferase